MAIITTYLVMSVALLLSIIQRFRTSQSTFVKNIFWYCLAAFLIINMVVFARPLGLTIYQVLILNFLSGIFNFCFLGIFIMKHLASRVNLKYARIIFILFYLLTLYATAYELTFFNSSGYFFTQVGLLILPSIYFLDLFQNIPSEPFWNYPEFWIISGIFTSNSILLPFLGFSHYYPSVKEIIVGYNSIISGLSLFILYAFICKGILCTLRTQK